jgi:TonB family protein
MAMNTSPNHSVLELDQFNFAEHSLMSYVGALFISKEAKAETNPTIDLAMDRSFGTANMAQEGNCQGSSRISDDFEYDGAVWATNPFAIDLEPVAGFMDESFVENIIDSSIDFNAPTISECCDLASYRKKTNILSSVFSTIAHLAVIFAFVLSNPTGSVGQQGNSPVPIFVRLIDPNSLLVQQNRHASVDSTASCPSIAKRSKGEKDKSERETVNPEPKSAMEIDKGKAPVCDGNKEAVTNDGAGVKFVEKDSSRSNTTEKNDDVNFESPSMMDSVASQASTAAKETRSAAPHGEDADQFKKMVLSAIHEVAFYPKGALHRREFGEALVSFTILSDGSIENLSVVRKSGSESLDKAALQIVEKASSHFPPIPETLGHNKLNYVIPITFRRKS